MKIKVESESAGRRQEEGILDFFKRNKQGPKRSASPIPQQGQFTQKRSASPIPQKGQFGGQKRKPAYGPRQNDKSIFSNWKNIEKENPQIARNMMFRIAPFVEIYPKDAKYFVQNGGMEYKITKDRVLGLYKNRSDIQKRVDFSSYVMALNASIGENERKMLMIPKYRDNGIQQIQKNQAQRLASLQQDISGDIEKSKKKKGVEFGDYDIGQMQADREAARKGQSFDDYLKSLKEEKPCWDGYKQVGMKLKLGKKVPNCVPVDESYDLEQGQLNEFVEKLKQKTLEEAEYQGKKVTLNKPIRTPEGPKKFKVYVKDGDRVKMVRFGDPNMKIKKSNPERRKSFRARHNCDNPGPKTSGKYWSCRNW